MLGPEDIRLVQFPTAGLFERDYRKADVDAFLRAVEESLRASTGNQLPAVDATAPAPSRTGLVSGPHLISAEDLHNAVFSKPPLGKRGYNEDEVDALLDLAEATIATLSARLAAYKQQ